MRPDVLPTLLAAASGGAEGEAHNPLLPATAELIWGSIAFLLLFLVLRKFAFPTVIKTLEERTASIEGKLEQAERDRAEAEELLRAYRHQLAEADAEAARIIASARTNADRLEAELRQKAEEHASRIVERAEQTIRAERDRAIQQLRNEVGTLAVDLASRIVGETLDRDRHLRLVDRYIDEMHPQTGSAT